MPVHKLSHIDHCIVGWRGYEAAATHPRPRGHEDRQGTRTLVFSHSTCC
jgi:hypothetical protein